MFGLWIVACAPEGLPPRVEARGGGAGYWPPNSRAAVEGAIAAGFEGIELDVALTMDRVPVLMADPWVAPERCTWADGAPIEPILLRRVTFEQLQRDFRCGGIPDPEFPNAVVEADTVMRFDEVIEALHGAPASTVVHLDIQQDTPLTAKPEVFAQVILDRWYAEDLPQAMYVTSPSADVLAAFDAHGRLLGFDVPTHLVFPAASPFALEAERWANGLDYVTTAIQAGADGLSLQWEIADRALVDEARDEGLTIAVWTVDREQALAEWTAPGRVDAVITSFPGDVP